VGKDRYASGAQPSSTSRTACSAERRAAALTPRLLEFGGDGGDRSVGSLERVRVEVALHGVHRRAERRILADGSRHELLEVASAGRCIPGMRTYPPSGIAPIPYSTPSVSGFGKAFS
jgi:hypothetical protein